jgi:hypothetical protein
MMKRKYLKKRPASSLAFLITRSAPAGGCLLRPVLVLDRAGLAEAKLLSGAAVAVFLMPPTKSKTASSIVD